MPDKTIQTLIGFDFGLKHIGVAVGQRITATATPLGSVRASNGKPHWQSIEKIIGEWQPDGIVVGIPLNMDSSDTKITAAAKKFARQLGERYHLPIWEMDERLTTVAAKEALFASGGYRALEKSAIDSYAAKLILESWLQEHTK